MSVPISLGRFSRRYYASLIAIACLIVIGILFLIFIEIPMPLHPLQILFVVLVGGVLPAKLIGSRSENARVRLSKPEYVYPSLLAALLGYINYVYFFVRVHIHARGLGSNSVVHLKASSLAVTAIVFCLLAIALDRFVRGQEKRLKSWRLWRTLLVTLFAVWLCLLNPVLQRVFALRSINWGDLGFALISTFIFVLAIEFERYNRKHSRKAVHAFHPEL